MVNPAYLEGFLPENSLTVGIEEILRGSLRPLPWIIEGILLADSLNLIFGPPKEFKTFVALDMALSQASGISFLERYEVLEPGLVIYVAGEGVAGIAHRISAWLSARGIDNPSDHSIPFRRTKGPLSISNKQSVQALSDEIDHIRRSMNIPVKGIYIDTLARNFGDGDENQTRDMNLFVQRCDHFLKQRFGAAVVVVHHTPVADSSRPRGAVSLMGACDAGFRVTSDRSRVRWEPQFMKDAETPPHHFLQVERTYLNLEGDFNRTISSITLRVTDTEPESESKLTQDQNILLQCLHDEWTPYSEVRQCFMDQAAKVLAMKGKNRGQKRSKNSLRPAFARTLAATEKQELIDVERCSSGSPIKLKLSCD